MEIHIISKSKNEFHFWKEKTICFVNVETDPRVWYIFIDCSLFVSDWLDSVIGRGGLLLPRSLTPICNPSFSV
jgi:hypothetical protein